MFLFAASITPFIFGQYNDELWCLTLKLSHNSYHLNVQFRPIISDNFARNSIAIYYLILDKSGDHLLCYIGIGNNFYPLGEVVNGDQDTMIPIRSFWLNDTDHVNAHIENAQGDVKAFKGVGDTCALSA